MKAFILALLFAATHVSETNAVQLRAAYTDDLIKSLAEDMQKDAEAEQAKPE